MIWFSPFILYSILLIFHLPVNGHRRPYLTKTLEFYKLNGHQGPYFANTIENQLLCSQITAVVSVKIQEHFILSQITALVSAIEWNDCCYVIEAPTTNANPIDTHIETIPTETFPFFNSFSTVNLRVRKSNK